MEEYKHFIVIATLCLIFFYTNVVSAGKIKYMDSNDNPAVNIDNENPTPIVGVLTQEVSQLILRKYPNNNYTSYIAASYVKYVEGAGGRVVPIWIGQKREYYEDLLSKINGVLLPGGATYFNQSHGYADAGRYIYEIAKEINDNGTYFPVWGTCLGFELLVYLSANSSEPRTYCSSSSQALPLEFKEDFKKSRMFRNASDNVIDILKNYAVTANFHLYCFTEETFANMKLNNIWDVMSLNHDWDGIEFISTIEHKKYPFYGTQFHPEKNIYEFIANRNITHTSKAIQASQYFADFLVNEARRNRQQFKNETEEVQHLIYNYAPVYTALKGSSFEQQYLFEAERSSAFNVMKINNLTILLSLLSGCLIYKLSL
ncbi:gamma-glutamyl hydrolase [Lucilia cuprina]|uniref:gamma-glutamyl hydrolase n=1 Tax=Lucilia cuprina TaxID=7375 RepID=UPI001F069375|nr:gamma-glutamyl hydrolase [Lucilia cuprina]XP_023297411.2 gamma-glutamyl hydrolase [Lucilia cuprina]XP_046807935.1 gamma-glutamyl hydrolase [Lucilia cuprina]